MSIYQGGQMIFKLGPMNFKGGPNCFRLGPLKFKYWPSCLKLVHFNAMQIHPQTTSHHHPMPQNFFTIQPFPSIKASIKSN
jgi:hypothetical protein